MAALPPSSPSANLDVAVEGTRTRSRGADFVALTKPRLNFLVVITTLAAYYLGVADDAPALEVVHTAVGTFLVAGGASALNQVWERHTDKLMRRTRSRPLPDMRLHHREALWFGAALSAVGLAQLWLGANLLAAAIALVTLVSYVAWYTPLKVRTSLSTIVGAIPGALPAVIGWAAATNTLSYEGWVLFAIVFLWQMPHFLAIAWMYRDDYARAGMPMLPVVEPDGRSTGRQAVIYAAALLPVSLLPTLTGMATMSYLVGASALGATVLWLAAEFAATRTMPTARRLFFATIIYLPLLWALLLGDHYRNA
jgi:protoheme IX farnesyltransferase